MTELVTSELRARWRFFLERAGYATPPGRAACALELARAEELLELAIGLEVARVRWEDDPERYDPGDVTSEEEARELFSSGRWTGPFGCIVDVYDVAGRELASSSLWSVVLGRGGTWWPPANDRPGVLWTRNGDPYGRVVIAELASELVEELRQAVGDARDAGEELEELETRSSRRG